MSDAQEPHAEGTSPVRLVIVDPDLPARQRKTLTSGLSRYPGHYLPARDFAGDAEVDLVLAGGAVVLALP
ncbi:hypothetical protein ACQEV2_42175 [Streptomyces sp. CA-251387]|uniref:hypothetical protein n=1 Tax=Streptomyces sp. CA-251387 TaxID=3240064 RepID=UPI003D8C9658